MVGQSCIVVPAAMAVFLLWAILCPTSRDIHEPLKDRRLKKDRRPTLAFQKRDASGKYKFKIVQITDIHLGEAPNLDWGPQQDEETWMALDAVLTAEAPVDLIVLGGDQLTANNCKDNATAYYQKLGDFLLPYGIPWALIFGNHDDTDFETDDGRKLPAKYSREDLLAVDQGFPLSLTQAGPQSIIGTTNYVLDIHHPNVGQHAKDEVVAQLLFLDSGGGQIEEAITDSQIDWVREEISKTTVPAMAFQHIPTESHTYSGDGQCKGLHDDALSPLVYDGGIVDALVASDRFLFLAAGHDHGNDYCCPYVQDPLLLKDDQDPSSRFHLCFGRHSGHGGYGGRWEKGARVYQLIYNEDHHPEAEVIPRTTTPPESEMLTVFDTTIKWSSHVRLESGNVTDRFIPRH